MLKKSVKYGFILFLVAGLSTMLVTTVNEVVTPIIVQRTAQKVKENLDKIYAHSPFTYLDITESKGIEENDDFQKLYEVTKEDGKTEYVYQMSPMGRNAIITYLIAFDSHGDIVKIQYVQMRETKGRGDKITEDYYLNAIYSQNAADISVETISGATYSTKAMKQSIEATAYHLLHEVLNEKL